MEKLYKTKNAHTAFRIFREDMNNIWKEYSFLNDCVSNAPIKELPMKNVNSEKVVLKKTEVVAGMRQKFLGGVNASSHFIQAIGLFERYIASLVKMVYLEYPFKINGGMDEERLFKLIISSESKEEMIKTLAEEKIRSIFYGNPLDIFVKDKCRLELGEVFKETYKDAMPLYQEITSRRNVIIHNSSRVDKKYLKENPGSTFKEKEKIIISDDYLQGAICLLVGIAAITTKCVVENIYHGDCKGKLGVAIEDFDININNGWYATLLSH